MIPAGIDPEASVHVNGPIPPAATRFCVYPEPMTPTGIDEVATDRGVAATEMESCFVALREPASSTRSVNVLTESEVAVGVPEMTPVDGFSVRPPGRLPSVVDHVNGPAPPETDRVCEYATVPEAGPSDDVEMMSGSTTRIVSARVVLRRLASVI